MIVVKSLWRMKQKSQGAHSWYRYLATNTRALSLYIRLPDLSSGLSTAGAKLPDRNNWKGDIRILKSCVRNVGGTDVRALKCKLKAPGENTRAEIESFLHFTYSKSLREAARKMGRLNVFAGEASEEAGSKADGSAPHSPWCYGGARYTITCPELTSDFLSRENSEHVNKVILLKVAKLCKKSTIPAGMCSNHLLNLY